MHVQLSHLRLVRIAAALVAATASLGPVHAVPAPDKPAPTEPATSMHDLQNHFTTCFHPPKEAADSRVTFYFSLTSKGEVVAVPRTVWFGFKGSADEKRRRLASFASAFGGCLPLAMNPALAASIPGKVYFLQYVVDASGATSQVLLRPFGSHGGGGVQPPPGLDVGPEEPAGPSLTPAEVQRLPAWAVRAPIRAVPFGAPYPIFLRPRLPGAGRLR